MELDRRTKGIPGLSDTFDSADIAGKGWNVLRQDMPLPLALLRETTLDGNAAWMRAFCENSGVSLAPHGKTTMCPQLFQRQIADGAWAITLSTAHQVQVARENGINRILVANQLVDPAFIDYVADQLATDAGFDFLCLVDSIAGVEILDARAKQRLGARRLGVLVEIGAAGGRTGVRSTQEAFAVARAVKASSVLELRGIEGFEGSVPGATSTNIGPVERFLDAIRESVLAADAEGLFTGDEIVLSAGGSSYFDLVIDRLAGIELSKPVRLVLRSGCYIAHDDILYTDHFAHIRKRSERASHTHGRLAPAIEVFAYVQSIPEAGLALLTAGKRDLSYDAHLPVPRKHFRPGRDTAPAELAAGYKIEALNDQHAYMRFPEGADLRIGDIIGLGISHPCTTFDKWDVLYGVDDDYNVVTAYKTFF
ncbi:amino acid deaminase [Kaistia terrae]|uniref:Amino acid deaminase n=1 Tax=Kaistia terrae TaxID=537017 RepID=A0ABW0Q265_9HYPH|nr:amino acid deaminase [Kaistia terrae]MCX5579678.1 amino acid deaminase [Kaistia terrae]